MIKWVLNFFSKKIVPQEAFIRWSQEELASKKIYLETGDPATFTLDDWMMVSDYLVQRYLPKDMAVDEDKWRSNRASMLVRMKERLPEMRAAAVANIAAKNSPTPYLEPVRYSLTREDFDIDILPNLRKFSFVPNPESLDWHGGRLADSYFLLSSSHYSDIRAAKDVVMGKCDDFAVMHVANSLRRNYETLRTAQIEKYEFVKLSSGRHACQKCKDLDGEKFEITDLLAKFRNASIEFPHETPPYDDKDDTAHWCEDIWFGMVRKHTLGDDPIFAAWLEKHFEKNRFVQKED